MAVSSVTSLFPRGKVSPISCVIKTLCAGALVQIKRQLQGCKFVSFN